MMARLLFAFAALLAAACGGGVNLEPEPFTRERADGKIPVKTELIRQQVRRELSGIPEGEAKVLRWQAIEADYHACRLAADKVQKTEEKVFADCMANRGYVYMHRIDAEQLHNDIAFEMEKDPDKWQTQVVTVTLAASLITITSAPPQVINTISETASDSGSYSKWLLGIGAAAGIGVAIAAGGGGGDNNAVATMPITDMPFAFDAPELGAVHVNTGSPQQWLVVLSASLHDLTTITIGHHRTTPDRMEINYLQFDGTAPFRFNRTIFHNSGDLVPLVENGTTITLGDSEIMVAFQTRPTITLLSQLCPIPWLVSYLNARFPGPICPAMNRSSYSPDMRRVVHAAMADGFNPGFAFGESGFAFSGRYDGDNRAAGFTYDLGGYAFRTDYIRLPSKQDSAVWLDTYRFGALTRINDEVQFFVGVDNYRNAIIAIDAKGDNMHRLGFALGDGYAVKYEYRLNL